MIRLSVFCLVFAALAPTAFAAEAGFDELLPKVAAFEYGQDASVLETVSELLTEAQDEPARLHEMAVKLAQLLDADGTTEAARLYICQKLYLFGDKDCLPYVAPMLTDDKTADIACYAIGRMPGPEALAALQGALDKAEPAAKVAIVNAIGQRREPAAVDLLAKAAAGGDKTVAEAAICALGLAGTPAALDALMAMWPGRDGAEQALIDAAAEVAKTDVTKAAPVLRKLYNGSKNEATRAACLKALAEMSSGNAAVQLVVTPLAQDDGMIRTAAADALRSLTAEEAAACAEMAPKLPPASQVMLVTALSDMRVAEAAPQVAALTASDNADVRLAAISALAALGDASTVPLLAKAAAGEDKTAARAARESLARLKGEGVDAAIAEALESDDAGVGEQLLGALARRLAVEKAPAVLKLAAVANEGLRQEAFKTLAKIGRAEDLPGIIRLLLTENSENVRGQAERAVVAIARRTDDMQAATAAALEAFPETKDDVASRASLVRVLGKLGDNSALNALLADLGSPNADLQEAAVRALMEWPTPAPLNELAHAAESGANDLVKRLALRAYLRSAILATDRPVEKQVALFQRGLEMAKSPDEKVMALAGLAECPSSEALEVIKSCADDPQVADEVKLALAKINNPQVFVTASDNNQAAANAIDGNPETRWTTGADQAPGQWFQIDLAWPAEVSAVVLDTSGSGSDYPHSYEIYVSNDTNKWDEPVAEGKGDAPVMEIRCKPKTGRYVRIVQTGRKSGLWWSIHELKVEKRQK